MKDEAIPLRDILKECEFLQEVRARSTLESFQLASADVRAVAYSVIVISEAVRRLPDQWLNEYPDTPWAAIRAIGNKLRHEYHRVSDIILWGIVATHAPTLRATVQQMLEKHGSAGP